ncbi:hypothetical protein CYMTET_50729 [Cymbomonas tetramitiformis]|uniref:Uncharacterized protein n=1 Tax=Cymbomonas tetramitiformis TaxID=36881 RepID=A0AAE0EUH1_9CHLO|nr:hypothetical protein CYMTET_50729 [Cymbomonas tetramitiformis]
MVWTFARRVGTGFVCRRHFADEGEHLAMTDPSCGHATCFKLNQLAGFGNDSMASRIISKSQKFRNTSRYHSEKMFRLRQQATNGTSD